MDCIYDMEDVKITVVCDLYEDRLEEAANKVLEKCGYKPVCCNDYREVVKRSDVDCVITPVIMVCHREIALSSMRAGKPVGMEVGGAYTLDFTCGKWINPKDEIPSKYGLSKLFCECFYNKHARLQACAHAGRTIVKGHISQYLLFSFSINP